VSERERLEGRLLVLAPTGRDGLLTCELLTRAGFTTQVCADLAELCREAARGAAALMIAEEVLRAAARAIVVEMLEQQPSWSDLPVLIFTGEAASLRGHAPPLDLLGPRANVTLLDRPLRPVTMLSAARAAVRARRRQYEAREEIERQALAVRQRDEFLAMLGHELRNPLGTILLAAEILSRGTSDDSAKQHDIIRRHGKHLARLMDDLLDVARVTSGKISLQRKAVDLHELVARCIAAIEPVARSQGLEIGMAGAPEPLFVDGDPVRLEQVVANLLANAVKYTPAGGHVDVSVSREGEEASIRVRDDGVGLDEETLSHAFDLFAQSERTLDRSQGGLGIGLTLVRSLVQLHGGTVHAQSEGRGSGSDFVVRLPLGAAPPPLVEPPGASPAAAVVQRILVVEDNNDMLDMMLCLLEDLGHETHGAEDGVEGVAAALRFRPTLALIDLGLPRLDGYGVARQIRAALGATVKLVALSGYGRPEDRQRAFDAGFDEHVTKPIEPSELERLLSTPVAEPEVRRSAARAGAS
jgi:signal transduction histidine kinase/ActR/RegA family two-component response regulator